MDFLVFLNIKLKLLTEYHNLKKKKVTLPTLLCRLFSISCGDVTAKLVSQIKAWQIGQSCLYRGERCSYEVRNISVHSYIVQV